MTVSFEIVDVISRIHVKGNGNQNARVKVSMSPVVEKRPGEVTPITYVNIMSI